MAKPKFIDGPNGRKIAYHKVEGDGPGVVFLGGFASDMAGTKAVYLEEWAKKNKRAFLRFDYSGHGESSEKFEAGCIGDWAADAMAAIETLTTGRQILVGSSMGGWIALLVARSMPEKVAGLVGIAAAPDFTEDSMWAWMDQSQRVELQEKGIIWLDNDYGDPYPITERLITDGRTQLVLRDPLHLDFPVRLLHGTADEDVDMNVALRLLDHAQGGDIRLSFIKGADHRFSDDRCLRFIRKAIHSVTMGIR